MKYLAAWSLYTILTVPLMLLGFVVIALAPPTVRRPSRYYHDGRTILAWRWVWLDATCGNDEDGVDGIPLYGVTPDPRQAKWIAKSQGWSRYRRIYAWAALRNSTTNLRFAPFFGILIEPARVRSWSGKRWWLAAQGYKAGFRWFWNGERCFWIGWKVFPGDANGLAENDSRRPGVGFAFQPWGSV